MKNIGKNDSTPDANALKDREAIRKASDKINKSRATAHEFLQRVGIITPSGKLKKAYR
jgi:hypothetical protein